MESESENCPFCLICSSSIITADIKVEICDDHEEDDNKSVINFLLSTLLEIPENEVVQQKEKLINQQLNIHYCESCTKLIFSARTIYREILELTQRFRKVQKQIVEQISNFKGNQHCATNLSTSNHDDGNLDFCTNFLNQHNFNGFGYPFVVNEIPVKTGPFSHQKTGYQVEDHLDVPVNEIKEEPISENEDAQSESDSDSEPSPPPKKFAKKVPIKKSPPSSSSEKVNRKSSPKQPPHPHPRKKPIPPTKQSKFDCLYPNYPKRYRDPITNRYHCLEPSCSKTYPRKTALERHVIVEHLQDNYYKCEEPNCGKSYADPEKFEDHISWHKGIPRWKCQEKVTTPTPDGGNLQQQCTEAFYCRRKLNRHVQQVHHKDKPFICEICGRKFTCQDYLSSHKYEKHQEKFGKNSESKFIPPTHSNPQICEHCGKSMSSKSALISHINRVHEKTVGKHECPFCEWKFMHKILLKQHCWRKHDKFSLEGYQGPKEFKGWSYHCDVARCKKNFLTEKSWRKHMEEKHGEGKEGVHEFHCKFCGKGFHVKTKRDYHEEAHENKESKPFSCEICGKRFAVMAYLKVHKKNVHKIPMERARGKKIVN